MCHCGPVKTPTERGPFANWVVEARNYLGLSSAAVAAGTGYSEPAIRKLEGGVVTRPQRQKVTDYLLSQAAQQRRPIPPPPAEGAGAPSLDVAAFLPLVSELVGEVRMLRQAQEAIVHLLGEVAADLAAAHTNGAGTPDAPGHVGDPGTESRPARRTDRARQSPAVGRGQRRGAA